MKNKIISVFSSQYSTEENNKFKEHISKTIGCDHKIVCYENNNKYSLCELYNRSLNEHHEKDSIFVFIHNDIFFKTNNWGKTLLRKFNNFNYDIIGVAGSTVLDDTGMWWSKREKMVGVVEHTDGVNTWVSDYNSKFLGIKEVVVIDGLFISINPDEIVHQFDEDFKGFHFYDISFCLESYLDGMNIGVTNEIRILHKSVGRTNDMWENNRKLFIKKYKQYLPIDIND